LLKDLKKKFNPEKKTIHFLSHGFSLSFVFLTFFIILCFFTDFTDCTATGLSGRELYIGKEIESEVLMFNDLILFQPRGIIFAMPPATSMIFAATSSSVSPVCPTLMAL
jgi:hypothetical protein